MGLLEVQQYAESHLAGLLGDLFRGVDLNNRLRVTRDIDKWTPEIEEIWEVKRGKRPVTYEIYFDDEFVCSFDDHMSLVKVDHDFLVGFLDLYQNKKIFLNKELYKERDEKIKYDKIMADEAKRVQRDKDLSKLSGQDRRTAEEVLQEVEKEKGHKKTK